MEPRHFLFLQKLKQKLQVDCTVERDLCSHHGVHGYPTLVLFQDGEKKEEYRQARDLDTLLQFVQEHSN